MFRFVSSWILKILLCTLVVSCGGGGSGGSDDIDTGPDNLVNNPDPALPQDLKKGLFTDAPVSGLRYEHGRISGYTSNGEFQYDANSSEPVCFYLGEIRLGCSDAGAIITPFDLSAPGQPASLQSGYNITRLLNSLDVSDTPEITLPADISSAKGVVNFAVGDGMFATDELVVDLVNRYAPGGTLFSREEASILIADNADVQAAIGNLNRVLAEKVSTITIRWNSALGEPGVLAHIESESTSIGKDDLYLEIGLQGSQFYLMRSTYMDFDGNYVHVRWNFDGTPDRVVLNGIVYAYLNYIETRNADWIDTFSYYPRKTGYLIGNGGFSSRLETAYVKPQSAMDINTLMSVYGSESFTQQSMLRVASHAMTITQNVLCAERTTIRCESGLSDALLNAVGDTAYRDQLIAWIPQNVSPDLCMPSLLGIDGDECGNSVGLGQFNIVMGVAINGFSGMEIPGFIDMNNVPESFGWPYDNVFGLELHKVVDGVHFSFTVACESDPEVYQFSDGAYYFAERAGSFGCVEPLMSAPMINCTSVATGYNVSCSEIGLSTLADWVGFDEDLAFAKQVASKARGQGVGFLLRFIADTNGGRYFGTADFSDFIQGGEGYLNGLLDNPQRDLRGFWVVTTNERTWRPEDVLMLPIGGALVLDEDRPDDSRLRWEAYGQYQKPSGETLMLRLLNQFSVY